MGTSTTAPHGDGSSAGWIALVASFYALGIAALTVLAFFWSPAEPLARPLDLEDQIFLSPFVAVVGIVSGIVALARSTMGGGGTHRIALLLRGAAGSTMSLLGPGFSPTCFRGPAFP